MIAVSSFLPGREARSGWRYNEMVCIAIAGGGRQKARCGALTVRI
jgi:hypothetical protein